MQIEQIERIIAIVGGIIVGIVAIYALKNDWSAQGNDNQVFKVMLALLAVGAILAVLAGAHVLGNFPKAAA